MSSDREISKMCTEIGFLRGEIKGCNSFLRSIDNNLNLVMSQLQALSTRTALHDEKITRHEKKISDLFRAVDVTENTGTLHFLEEKTRWSTIKIVVSIIAGLIGLAATYIGIYYQMKK